MNRLTISMITVCAVSICGALGNVLGSPSDTSGRQENGSVPPSSESAKSINIDALGRPENDALADTIRNPHYDYYLEPSRVFSQQVGAELEGLTLPKDMERRASSTEAEVGQTRGAQISGSNEASETRLRMFWAKENGALVRVSPGGVSLASLTPIPIRNSPNRDMAKALTIILIVAIIGTLLIAFEIV